MAKLDIIVTHYNEPWEVGKKFFDMIENQQNVNKDEFTVTLVQDGTETTLPFDKLLSQYSFNTKLIKIKHAGVAAARNVGFDHTSSEWVMFCDFDDMFSDVCSLNTILSNIPAPDYDLIWNKCVIEMRWKGDVIFFNCINESDLSSVVGKLYNRKFLNDKHIRFNPSVPMFADHMFNCLVLAETQPFRVVKLTAEFYPYFKKYRINSYRMNHDAMHEILNTRFDRDIVLARTFSDRGLDYDYRKTIAYIICSEYFRVYDPEREQNPVRASDRFLEFYRENRGVLKELSECEMDVIKESAEVEIMSVIQRFYNDFLIEYYLVNDTLSFNEWIQIIDQVVDQVPTTAEVPVDDHAPVTIENEPVLILPAEKEEATVPVQQTPAESVCTSDTPRVAVYCGTYNTYMNMMTSAKSLLWNTRMDKIYFLIEDDVFPYELPDIIECINVKNQQFFSPDGPNYNNSWSYMCMMRAAFTKLIPYDKILSLDIDVVIQEDIGCLWDVDLTDYYLAGVTEPQRQRSSSDPIYINFGVVMMNLAKLRQDGMDDKIIESLNNTKHGCPEQDAFNKLCAWHIYQIPNDYNATVHSHITGEYEKERIIHYAGIRFWRHFGHVKEYGIRKWDVIMQRQNELKGECTDET